MKPLPHLLPVLLLLSLAGLQAKAQYSFDSVTFEKPVTKIVIEPSAGNLWQIGTPHKTFFDGAFAGTKAMVTDTVNSYPAGNTSTFTYIIRDPYTRTCFTRMEFWHKYEMDSIGDSGTIDASYDGGNSWLPVSDTTLSPWGSFFYWEGDYHASSQNYTTHKLIANGKSDGWIRSAFIWQWFIPVKKAADTILLNPDSLMIRFTFHSDSTTDNREGWMIDEIVTSSAWGELCSGLEENQLAGHLSVTPNPVSRQATLYTDHPMRAASLLIYDSFGRAVKEIRNLSGNNFILFRDNLPSGIYYLRLAENNAIFASGRLIISD